VPPVFAKAAAVRRSEKIALLGLVCKEKSGVGGGEEGGAGMREIRAKERSLRSFASGRDREGAAADALIKPKKHSEEIVQPSITTALPSFITADPLYP
jgi:hypothetical protein